MASYDDPLFRKLRPHGAYFSHVKAEDGLRLLLDSVAARAKAHPAPYGHWYIDGGDEADHAPALTCVSYRALEPVRAALLRKMQIELDRPGMGPEELRTLLARCVPPELGMNAGSNSKPRDEVLDRFQVKLLTEGSGTQIFSTSFAQWAAREALRRAQPLTLLVRLCPATAAEADERTALGSCRHIRIRSRRFADRRRLRRILQLAESATPARG